MALGMSAADVAVSKQGTDELVVEIQKRIEKARQIADRKGVNFLELEKTIRTYWVGVDCDNFINDLRHGVFVLSNNLLRYGEVLTQGVNTYYEGFKEMQKSTYKAGQVKI